MSIITNKAQCRNCKSIIESTHRHDFVVCACWNQDEKKSTGIAVDGGKEYLKRCGNLEDIIELSEYTND